MRKSICSIVLGLLAAPAAAQPGQTPVMPSEPPPVMQPQPYPEPQPYLQPMPPDAQPMPPPQPPPGATSATFVSTGEARWDVRIDNNAVCSTPCSLLVEPMRYVMLYSQERTPARLAVGYLPPGDVLVQAKPRGRYPTASRAGVRSCEYSMT